MPVFDVVGFLKAIKDIAIKIFTVGAIIALKASTWVFIISSFVLASTMIVKFYNWFSGFKTYFDTTSTSTHLSLAKASGLMSAMTDLFSFFLLILTVFISYKASVYMKKFAKEVSKEAQDIAMLIG
jgi:hypothetical protein